MRKSINLLILLCVSFMIFSCASLTALAAPIYNIRPGAADEEAWFWIEGVKQGFVSPSDAQDVIDSGGFSPEVAAQVQSAINEVQNGTSTTPSTEESNDSPTATTTAECEHDYSAETIKEATCSESGELKYTCTLCGDIYTISTDKIDHEYLSETTSEASCEKEGTITYNCINCGDSYTESLSKTEHIEGDWTIINAPSCQNSGLKAKKCTVCDKTLSEETIEKLDHIEGDWKITTSPTLTKSGIKALYCNLCNEELKTETVPANHMLLICIIIAVSVVAGSILFLMIRRKNK